MTKWNLGLAALLALFAVNTSAGDLDYTYLDLSYSMADYDGVDGDGLNIDYSSAINDDAFWLVGYSTASADEGGVEVEGSDLFLGYGHHWSVSDKANFEFSGGLVRSDIELTIIGFGSASDDDTGFFLRPGFRGWVSETVEMYGQATYVDIFDDNSTAFSVGGIIHMSKSAALTLDYTTDDDVDAYTVGIRFAL